MPNYKYVTYLPTQFQLGNLVSSHDMLSWFLLKNLVLTFVNRETREVLRLNTMSGTVVMNGVNSLRDHIVSDAIGDRLPYVDFEIDEQHPFEGSKIVLKTLRSEWSPDDIKFTVSSLK